jgi:hypothetical protein
MTLITFCEGGWQSGSSVEHQPSNHEAFEFNALPPRLVLFFFLITDI